MSVAIIDCGSGNLRSVAKAFEKAGGGRRISVTSEPGALAAAGHIVLPGVGAFADCRRGLERRTGMVAALEEQVLRRRKPFLGICVGMQLMADAGIEFGVTPGLGWIAGTVEAIDPAPEPSGRRRKVPHMGWNIVRPGAPAHPVFAGLGPDSYCYFVHSYGFRAARAETVLARADYGGEVAAGIGRDNLVGTQFHPEKSQAAGLRLIENFLAWRP